MKAGILTFHRSRNYGAVLQAYALCKVMNDLGVETELIDYKCLEIEKSLKLWVPQKNLIKSAMRFFFRYRKKRAFDSFGKNYFQMSREMGASSGEIIKNINQYNSVVVGSDQVWNTQITGEDNTYLLAEAQCRKIAYAASAGDVVEIDESTLNYIAQFDYISVREKKLHDYLQEKGISSRVCCDPTILAGRECFEQIASPPIMKEKYVFVFMIWESDKLLKNAELFARKNGLKLVNNKNSIEFFLHSNPVEFLSWIKNAEFVITNSFHGTVLSMLFQKNFLSSVCKKGGNKNLRVYELLSNLDCLNNVISDENEQITKIDAPNYNLIEKKMKEIQLDSLQFLQNALNECTL